VGRKGIYALPVVAIAVLLLAMTPTGSADLISTTAPSWLGKAPTLNTNVSVLSSPTTSAEELPGLGHKFELFGVMKDDTDPENPDGTSGSSGGGGGGNETISATMTPADYALAYRSLGTGIKISALTDQLGLKYYFVAPRTCGGGSPRISLQIDSNGDGTPDFTAHGHVFAPVYAGCPTNVWEYEDLTDDLPRWEITPGGVVPGVAGYPFLTWKQLVAALGVFPNLRVLSGYLVDDSCSFDPLTCGKAYYDLVTIENRTLEIWQDTVH